MSLYTQFDTELLSCRKCEQHLATVPIDPSVSDVCVKPRPIVSGIRPKPILLIGQAPGITEYESGKPFQGQAGQKIRDIFREVGVMNFDETVSSSAVVKCFPGRKFRKKDDPDSGVEDRVPSTTMVRNCRPFLERQFLLVNPAVVVTLGAFSLKAYLQISGQEEGTATLSNFVGTSQEWDERSVVFFPHTSGGARWLNSPDNQALFARAKTLLQSILIRRGIASGT